MDKRIAHTHLLLSELRNYNDSENQLTVVLRNGIFKVSKLLFLLSESKFILSILEDIGSDASVIIIPEISHLTFSRFIDLVCRGVIDLENLRDKVKLQQLIFLMFGMPLLEFNSEIFNDEVYKHADDSDDDDDNDNDGLVVRSFESFKGNPNMCMHCGKLLYDKSTRTRHEKTCVKNRVKSKGHKCDICGKILKTKIGLHTHQDVTHFQKHLTYTCEKCNKKFKHESSLKRHLKIHEKNTRYKCDFCNYKSIRKDNIYRHEEKKHKVYNLDVETLKQQLQPNINYKCPQCSRKFTKMEAIKHLKLTNCNDLTCLYCDKIFTQKSHLRKHLRTIHKNK